MIDPKELRIGNWVHGYSSNYEHVPSFFKVESLDEGRINPYCAHDGETWYAKEVTPIPLTTEILEKCGLIEANSFHELQVDGINFVWDNSGLDVSFEGNQIAMPLLHIKSLHQLQNLYFALTGSELKIEL